MANSSLKKQIGKRGMIAAAAGSVAVITALAVVFLYNPTSDEVGSFVMDACTSDDMLYCMNQRKAAVEQYKAFDAQDLKIEFLEDICTNTRAPMMNLRLSTDRLRELANSDPDSFPEDRSRRQMCREQARKIVTTPVPVSKKLSILIGG